MLYKRMLFNELHFSYEEGVVNLCSLIVERESSISWRMANTFECPHKIKVPGCTPKLTVSDDFKACLFLLLDKLCNSFVLYLLELVCINLTFFKLNTSLLKILWTKKATNNIKAMWSSFIIFDCHNDPLELLTRNQYDNQHFTCEIQILD